MDSKVLELLLAQASLIDFVRLTHPDYRPAAHHLRIAEHLEAIERGDIDRLMIFMPPRHGKSELASRRFPAWCLGRDPTRQIIATSYNGELACDFGRDVRNLMLGREFALIFPDVMLRADSQAADRFNTAQGGVYHAAGVGGSLTGRGADILLIDDPVKDREAADSATMRRRTLDWYHSTLATRLMPGGRIVLIQTRWHEDDLAGRLLAEQKRKEDDGEWTVLDLPALSEAGEALWPEWFPLGALERIRNNAPPREWSALWQQRPQPDQGTFFQREWLREWKERPERLNVYGASDYAVSEGRGDYTVHQVWGVDAEGALYRLAVWRGRTNSAEWVERKLDLIREYKPLAWFGEAGKIQLAVEPMIVRRMYERNIFCRLEWLSSVHDKAARAQGFAGRAALQKVRFEPGADVSEYLAFPAGKHDDEVDASSLIGRALDMMHPAIFRREPEPEKRPDRWERLFRERDDDDGDFEDDWRYE